MAEISNRAVATAAAGAVLAVGLAFVGKADATPAPQASYRSTTVPLAWPNRSTSAVKSAKITIRDTSS